jgi:hypothetical protein
MSDRTTYARARVAYDPDHENELVEAITRAIFETSMVSDVNCAVIRTGEAASC